MADDDHCECDVVHAGHKFRVAKRINREKSIKLIKGVPKKHPVPPEPDVRARYEKRFFRHTLNSGCFMLNFTQVFICFHRNFLFC